VQLGSFSSEQNAQRLARDLRSRGFAIEVSRVRSGGNDLHRVRAGPENSRAAAEALKARLGPAARDSKLVAP
jgi:cell division septation protein DedD